MKSNFDYDSYISPCKDLCKLDVDKKYCIGCKRTITELKNWKNYTKETKMHIMNNLLPNR